MAIANLLETLQFYKLRKNQLNFEIIGLQSQKQLAVASTADTNSLLSHGKAELREQYREMYEESEELQLNYNVYTDIPDFEDAMNMLTARFQDELDNLANWENLLNNQITTKDTEIKEIEAYEESVKKTLGENISEDFNYGGIGG